MCAYRLFPDFSQVRRNVKREAKLFLQESLHFFQKSVLFSTNSQFLKKCRYNFRSKFQISLLTHTNCLLRFVTLDNTRKNGPKTFVIVKTAFFKKFVSIDLLGPKDLILSVAQSLSKYLVEP